MYVRVPLPTPLGTGTCYREDTFLLFSFCAMFTPLAPPRHSPPILGVLAASATPSASPRLSSYSSPGPYLRGALTGHVSVLVQDVLVFVSVHVVVGTLSLSISLPRCSDGRAAVNLARLMIMLTFPAAAAPRGRAAAAAALGRCAAKHG